MVKTSDLASCWEGVKCKMSLCATRLDSEESFLIDPSYNENENNTTKYARPPRARGACINADVFIQWINPEDLKQRFQMTFVSPAVEPRKVSNGLKQICPGKFDLADSRAGQYEQCFITPTSYTNTALS